ncbi:apl3p [Saccharomyces arboricola H-6]|uniref:AP-2 complex subunit alpha n=1 Tax=Saccharomyces arboricola (strain H-6 / AS 2.3317 / CBS 10644) TaxID=1160507 RepID=J8LR76_SACAR|nr:apl3p [Saccharomyces arboricola H-6]
MDRKKSLINSSVSNNNSAIKGLQLFIADLRSAQQAQEQERRIQSEIVKIKQHFDAAKKKQGNHDRLGGYQRKKYVAKLAYIYITSNTTKLNDVLFGLDQIAELLKSNSFSEKFIGYMTLELLYEHNEVVTKINDEVNYQLTKDLSSSDDNFVMLALNFIGVVGKLTNRLAYNDDITTGVFKILRSPTSSIYLKKKSALAFLALLKSNHSILTDDLQRKQLWIQRILSLLDDTENYRLTLATIPLIEFIAKHIDPGYCTRLLPQLTAILYNCVVTGTSTSSSNQFPLEYTFANMPNPWLITKVVSLLSILIASPTERDSGSLLQTNNIDIELLNKLRKCVSVAIELGTRQGQDPMERIVQNTVLFSLINFASKLDPSDEAISNSVSALCSLLASKEINIRYLTLDSLVKLCSSSGKPAIDAVRYKHLDMIFHLLNTERDSSIIRKVVDLLYTFTDVENVKIIVDGLLQYILSPKNLAEPQIKSDIAVKIAILTEKYATDINWFVIISLKLLSLTSNTTINDDEIWQRLCQIVVNNPSLHRLTCEQLVDYLCKKQASEAIVKAAAFLLGEYSSLLTDKISGVNLFSLLAEKYFSVSNVAKAMILTTMIKMYKTSPEIGSNVIKFFQLELNSLDIELQTRSFEYLNIIQLAKVSGNVDVLQILFEPMPPFNSKSNPLLKRLGSLPTSAGSTTLINSPSVASSSTSDLASKRTTSFRSVGVPMAPPSRKNTSSDENPNVDSFEDFSGKDSYYSRQILAPNWREGFTRMISHKQGVLFTSSLIKVFYRIITVDPQQPFAFHIRLAFINLTEWEITGLSTQVIASKTQGNPEYVITNVNVPSAATIKPNKRVEQSYEVSIRKPFDVEDSPLLAIHFKCGGSTNTINLKTAIGMTTTLVSGEVNPSMHLSLPQFISRWKTLSEALGKDGEYQISGIKLNKDFRKIETVDLEDGLLLLKQIVNRLGFDIVEQTSVHGTLFVSGIIHTKSEGNFGCLMKVQYQENGLANVTCKTTTAGPLAKYIVECIRNVLTK